MRLAGIEGPAATNPLENVLGVNKFGTYQMMPNVRPPEARTHAFDKLANVWDKEVVSSDSDGYKSWLDAGEQHDPDLDENKPTEAGDGHAAFPSPDLSSSKNSSTSKEDNDPPLELRRQELWETVSASKDRLFFIAFKPASAVLKKWYLAKGVSFLAGSERDQKHGVPRGSTSDLAVQSGCSHCKGRPASVVPAAIGLDEGVPSWAVQFCNG